MATPYNHRAIEVKWRQKWEANPINVDDGKIWDELRNLPNMDTWLSAEPSTRRGCVFIEPPGPGTVGQGSVLIPAPTPGPKCPDRFHPAPRGLLTPWCVLGTDPRCTGCRKPVQVAVKDTRPWKHELFSQERFDSWPRNSASSTKVSHPEGSALRRDTSW